MEKNKENQGNVQSNVKIEWDLTKIYSNIDELKKDIEKELSIIEKMTTFKGKLNNKKDIFDFFKLDEEAELISSKTTAYINLSLQKNMKDLEMLKIDSEIESKFKKLSKKLVFVQDELLANDKEFLEEILEDPEFERFNNNLRHEFSLKGHILTQEQKLLMNHIGRAKKEIQKPMKINEIKFEKAEDKNRKSS